MLTVNQVEEIGVEEGDEIQTTARGPASGSADVMSGSWEKVKAVEDNIIVTDKGSRSTRNIYNADRGYRNVMLNAYRIAKIKKLQEVNPDE
jgi:hypothetical protein